MIFKNRKDAGQQLAKALEKYRGAIVLGLPRGGVAVASEIAHALGGTLDIALAHKIGHPASEEYAVAAVSESGIVVFGEVVNLAPGWLEERKKQILEEMRMRRKLYFGDQAKPSFAGKRVILVDDGIATGLTMKAAIAEVQSQKPEKLIVAVPIAPMSTADELREMVDDFVALRIDPDGSFLGSIGAYYEAFTQVTDEEVKEFIHDIRH